MPMKNSSDINGNRTRDLPTCSAVPQTTAPPRTPIYITLITFLPLFKRWRIYYKIYTFLSLTEKDSNSGNVIRDFCWSRWHWDIAKWQNVCGPDRQENEIRYQEHIHTLCHGQSEKSAVSAHILNTGQFDKTNGLTRTTTCADHIVKEAIHITITAQILQ